MTYAPVSCFYASARHTRRTLLTATAAVAATAVIGRNAVRADSAVIEEGLTFVTNGSADGPQIAVVLGMGEALGFMTDGATSTRSFTGSAGRSVMLSADDGAELTGAVEGDVFNGRITLPDGSATSFSAGLAQGIAGLYAVELKDGLLTGTSRGGRRLTARAVASLPDDTLLIAGAMTGADGGVQPLATFISPDSWGEQWWIIQENGTITGGCGDHSTGYGYIRPHSPLELSSESLATFLSLV
jgi:hypothetical protein